MKRIAKLLREKIGIEVLGMLLKEKTKAQYGYEVEELSETSRKPVLVQCDDCGKEVSYTNEYYQRAKAGEKEQKCFKCSHKHRQGRVVIDIDHNGAVELPPEVLHQETEDKFGYKPQDLNPWSRKKVLLRCSVLRTIHEVPRCQLNRSKSIKETGHYISVGGIAKLSRTGAVASEETRRKMKQSQIKRRIKEKCPKTNNLNQGE